jgi:hypothetical protein
MKTGAEKKIRDTIRDAKEFRDVPLRPVPPVDVIVVPNDNFSFSESARSIFSRLAQSGRYFARGGIVTELAMGEDGLQSLAPVTPSALRSRLDREAPQVAAYVRIKNALALREKRCSYSNAEALLDAVEARELLPSIGLVAQAAVIVPGTGGRPKVLGPGYHPVAGGVLVLGRETPPRVNLREAVQALADLLVDFSFAAPGDRSRAVAAMVTPGLKMGGWLHGPSPIDVAESDQSQAGKGYRLHMVQAIYAEQAYLVAQRDGGVGSLDESISAALLSGRPFVTLDNIRGRLDSKFLESVITWPQSVRVRVPHRGEVSVDARNVNFQLSSNGIEATRDLVNRCSITRIQKHPNDYVFHECPEGDVLSHIKARAAYYRGCVFAVIEAWANAGRPQLKTQSTGFHDFKEWAGVLGWIVQDLFRMSPLLEGHTASQARASDPALSWLRSVCLAADQMSQVGSSLSATAIAELCDQAGIDLPGLRSPAADDQARKQVGKLLARCFRDVAEANELVIEGFVIHRIETVEYDRDHRCDRAVRRYQIERAVARCAP